MNGIDGFNGSTVREPWLSLPENTTAPSVTALQWVHGSRTVVIDNDEANETNSAKMLQWVHGSRTVVIGSRHFAGWRPRTRFNGSTVREPWLSCGRLSRLRSVPEASMGPRFANRGYRVKQGLFGHLAEASMGPRFANRGYRHLSLLAAYPPERQGFNGSTVREPWLSLSWQLSKKGRNGFNGSTVREPWLSVDEPIFPMTLKALQWVHGSRTVVIGVIAKLEQTWVRLASMGPRFANRGYRSNHARNRRERQSFNGSTVREPWLSIPATFERNLKPALQWVHGSRTAVIVRVSDAVSVIFPMAASMGPRFANRGYRRPGKRTILGWGLQWVHGSRTVVIVCPSEAG